MVDLSPTPGGTYVGVVDKNRVAQVFGLYEWLDRHCAKGEVATFLPGTRTMMAWASANRVLRGVRDERADRAMDYVLKYVEKRENADDEEDTRERVW